MNVGRILGADASTRFMISVCSHLYQHTWEEKEEGKDGRAMLSLDQSFQIRRRLPQDMKPFLVHLREYPGGLRILCDGRET